MTYKVLITDRIDEAGIELLEERGCEVSRYYNIDPSTLYANIVGYDALIVRTETKVNELLLRRGSGRLKVVGRAGVGLDNIDVKAAEEHGIQVINTPDANTRSAAEHTFAMMLALARHIPQATGGTRQGRWERDRFYGTELRYKSIAIIGVGRVGSQVANFCRAFQMIPFGYDPRFTKDPMNPHILFAESPEVAVHNADFVTIHTPLTDETRGMINEHLIFHMKDGVRIINCARGELVNQQDLITVLDSGKVSGYACDVFEGEPVKDAAHPFYQRRNVICTPHIGAQTYEAQKRVSVDICAGVIEILCRS